jgi:hypothetical protein
MRYHEVERFAIRNLRDEVPESGQDVIVDRRTEWGNPFRMGRGFSRGTVIQTHRRWLWGEIKAGRLELSHLTELHGKTLFCWCAPQRCHAETLYRAAHWAAGQLGDDPHPNCYLCISERETTTNRIGA